jgi:predicted chitinase
MKKIIITENQYKFLEKNYNITEETENEKIFGKFLTMVKDSSKQKSSEDGGDMNFDLDNQKTSDKSTPTQPIKEFNANEQIVFNQLKEDGFTDEASAAVMGVVGGESGFKTFKEASYRNTANSRIRAIFPSKLGKYSDEQLNSIKQSDEAFFNAVYGGMYGNAPNEGWKYVGRGFNGITFKGNYEAAKKCTGIDFVSNPELMEDPKYAAKALSCYFKVIKDINNFEQAFREAFRQNAGPGNSWEYYANSTNPVAVTGIPLKRGKAQQYYNKITGKQM